MNSGFEYKISKRKYFWQMDCYFGKDKYSDYYLENHFIITAKNKDELLKMSEILAKRSGDFYGNN